MMSHHLCLFSTRPRRGGPLLHLPELISLRTPWVMEVQETQRREQERKEELARMERERAELFKRHLQLLLMMFDDMARADNAHRRGGK
jgi:hypothetical protein